MSQRYFVLVVAFLVIASSSFAQNDPVLFTVEQSPVNLSEFKYIYSKTNGDKADFSEASLKEYLDLYVKFKLKVQRAREMQLDTIPTLIRELEGYRKQLANSYLVDKQVTERLVKEAFERSQSDIDISHIMMALPKGGAAKDTLAAFKKIQAAQALLKSGKTFEEVAKEVSEDNRSKDNGGRMGYVTAMLPNGFYSLESAAYDTKAGQVSSPIRTNAGYHLIKVNQRRTARGEVEISHILLRTDAKKNDEAAVKTRIDSVYQALNAGADFKALAQQLSQDKKSAGRGGHIGFFGINRYEKSFENAAFGLAKDGDISEPVKTSVGWHILQRVSKRDQSSYEIARRRLQAKIQASDRYELAKKAMIKRIKKENSYKRNEATWKAFTDTLSKAFLTYQWKPVKGQGQEVLFTLGDQQKYLANQFATFCQRAARQRLRAGRNTPPIEVANTLYDAFVEENCIKYEESQLEAKYPEFKALMREYREGILLFEATKMQVWDKASQDSMGLVNFHETVKDKYMWDERAKVSVYTLNTSEKIASKIRKQVKKKSGAKLQKKLNKYQDKIAVQEQTLEKDDPMFDGKTPTKGMVSDAKVNPNNKSVRFLKVEEILPKTHKSIDEARGYIIADYQDHLEKEWVKTLEDSYKVNIDYKVLDSIVK